MSYTGASLFDFLNTTVDLKTNPAVKNDSLGMYAVATGSDGYQAVFALGELDPFFNVNTKVDLDWAREIFDAAQSD